MLKPCAVVELVWQDETGSTAVTQFNTPSSIDNADIDTALMGVVSIFASLTGCTLIKTRVKYTVQPDEQPVPADSTPITRTGIFFFTTGGSTPDGLVSVPSLKDSVIMSTGSGAGVLIDLSNSDVIAFGDAVADNGISNPFGDDYVSLSAAYIQSRV